MRLSEGAVFSGLISGGVRSPVLERYTLLRINL